MLGEMIQYKNYAAHDPLYPEASFWAMSHKNLFPVDKRSLLEPWKTALAGPRPEALERDLDIQVLG
jgi:hypothetical protein